MVWYLYLSEPPDSHLETACLETPSFSASSSWDQPLRLRSIVIFSAMIIMIHPFCRRSVFFPFILAKRSVADHQADGISRQPTVALSPKQALFAVASVEITLIFSLFYFFPYFPYMNRSHFNIPLYSFRFFFALAPKTSSNSV